MSKVRIAFYKDTSNFVNALIAGWTYLFNKNTPSYSHVELGINKSGKWMYFSSTNRGGCHGTRWEADTEILENPERWDVYEISPLRCVEDIEATCNAVLNKGYDWWGIMGFATIFGLLNSKEKWYCSEVCYYALIGQWKKRISPRGFYNFIKSNFDIEKIIIQGDL